MFPGDYASASKAERAVREGLVSLMSSKADLQNLIEDISKKIDQSQRPHFALVSLVQIIGAAADRYCSLKGLECLLRVLRLLEEGFDDFEYGADMIFFGVPPFLAPDGDAVFRNELVAVGRCLRGREVVKPIKRALETQGGLTKDALLRALPEFDPTVLVELIPTIKDLANNDAQRLRDTAWESLKRINFARETWRISESAATEEHTKMPSISKSAPSMA